MWLWLKAIGLVLVLEGITPFVAPASWRQTMVKMSQMQDRSCRIIGCVALLIGAAMVVTARHYMS